MKTSLPPTPAPVDSFPDYGGSGSILDNITTDDGGNTSVPAVGMFVFVFVFICMCICVGIHKISVLSRSMFNHTTHFCSLMLLQKLIY